MREAEGPALLSQLLAGMRGRALRATDPTALLVAGLEALPKESGGLELLLERPEDGTGVALRIDLLHPGASPGGAEVHPPPGGWPVRPSGGGWKDLEKALGEALRAGPREPVEARVRVLRD